MGCISFSLMSVTETISGILDVFLMLTDTDDVGATQVILSRNKQKKYGTLRK